MDDFYRNVLELEQEPSLGGSRVTAQGYAGKVAFVTDGNIQMHLAERDLDVAFRTDDIEAVKKRLDEKGIRYADYGNWAMNGWYQIFFHDPEGNVIEVHQVQG